MPATVRWPMMWTPDSSELYTLCAAPEASLIGRLSAIEKSFLNQRDIARSVRARKGQSLVRGQFFHSPLEHHGGRARPIGGQHVAGQDQIFDHLQGRARE